MLKTCRACMHLNSPHACECENCGFPLEVEDAMVLIAFQHPGIHEMRTYFPEHDDEIDHAILGKCIRSLSGPKGCLCPECVCEQATN